MSEGGEPAIGETVMDAAAILGDGPSAGVNGSCLALWAPQLCALYSTRHLASAKTRQHHAPLLPSCMMGVVVVIGLSLDGCRTCSNGMGEVSVAWQASSALP